MAETITRKDADALIPEEEVMSIITGVRKQSVAMQLFRQLPNMSARVGKVPVLEMLPTADFVDGDQGMKITTKMAWGKKQLVVGEIAAIIPIPEAVLDDSTYDIWGQASPALIEAFGRVFDNQVFNGGNPKAPTEWPEGLIPAAIAAGQVINVGDGRDILADLSKTFEKLEDNEYDITGVAGLTSLRSKLRNVRDDNGQFLFTNPTSGSDNNPFGVPVHYAGKGTWDRTQALAIAGEWDNAVYSIRQDMTFRIFTEGVITDDDGKVVYNLMQQDMVALRAVMRLAWQTVNPIDIDRDAKAFPFAVLAPSGVNLGGGAGTSQLGSGNVEDVTAGTPFEGMTIAQLQAHAASNNIVIPQGTTRRNDIAEVLLSATN